MILNFRAEDVRNELAHAHRSAVHVDASGAPSGAGPSLLLKVSKDEVCLVSSGRPASGTSAHAIDFDPAGATGSELGEIGDLAEAIAEDAFARPLAGDAPRLSIVVTRSYINLLGGQPPRSLIEQRAPNRALASRSRPSPSRAERPRRDG